MAKQPRKKKKSKTKSEGSGKSGSDGDAPKRRSASQTKTKPDRAAQAAIAYRRGYHESWYHGLIPREDVEKMLKVDGDYLVRTTKPLDENDEEQKQVLTALKDDQAKHFFINETSKGTVYIKTYEFDNVPQMIKFYSEKRILVTQRSGVKLERAIQRQKWELLHEQVKLNKKIGEGAFGGVYAGELRYGRLKVAAAIKQAHLGTSLDKSQLEEIMVEARLMRQYSHPNIVTFYGVAAQQQPLLIVMELVRGGGLDSYLQKNAGKLNIRTKIQFALDASKGLEYLHGKNCIHRDIAARNCLIDNKTKVVKISDFGLSRQMESIKMEKNTKIPIKHLAPEVPIKKAYTQLSDVYSFGIMLWEILSDGAMPYEDMTYKDTARTVKKGGQPPIPKNIPDSVIHFIQRCWHQDPQQRPTFTEACKILERIIQELTQ